MVNLGKYTIHGSYGCSFTGVLQHHLTVASYGNALNDTYISLMLDSLQDASPITEEDGGSCSSIAPHYYTVIILVGLKRGFS